MIEAHERKTGRRYGWTVRSRPDAKHTRYVINAVRQLVAANDGGDVDAPRAWYRYSARSDVFALLTRGAARTYGSIWRDEMRDGRCEGIGLGDPPNMKTLERHCAPMKIRYKTGTECLVTAHLAIRGNVNVSGHAGLTPKLIRPGGGPPGRRR